MDGSFSWGAYLRQGASILVMSMALAAAFTALSEVIPCDLRPNLALSLVLGLLFGPFACLGCNIVSLAYNLWEGISVGFCLLDLLSLFVVAYLPYRMWYGTSMGCDPSHPPSLDGVRYVRKLMAVLLASSLAYTVIYNMAYNLLRGRFDLAYDDVSIMLVVTSCSIILGLGLILLFRYLGVGFYRPHSRFRMHDLRDRMPPWAYTALFLASVIVAPVVITLSTDRGLLAPLMALTYALTLAYLSRPVAASDVTDAAMTRGMYHFDGSLIERIIFILVGIGLVFSIACGTAAYYGFLEAPFVGSRTDDVAFYIGLSALAFFAVGLMFLTYVENRVSTPLERISETAREFVGESGGMGYGDAVRDYERYEGMDSEIGVLARSLADMTRGIEAHVESIRELTAREEKYRTELSVAASIQASLVPTDFGSVADMGVRLGGAMVPAKYVGGDLYDFFRVDRDRLALVVADVSGKGVPAAIFMAVTKALMGKCATPGAGPDRILAEVNGTICRNNEEAMLVTAWLGILDTRTGRLDFACAGHLPPLVARASGRIDVLRGHPSMALGGLEGTRYRREAAMLGRGDRLVLYTDGVTEANDGSDEFYGRERLEGMLRAHASDDVETEVSAIVADVSAHGGPEQYDDITLLIAEYAGRDVSPGRRT